MNTQESASSPAPLLPKACDHCRVRKVRCDRRIPCSNCTASGISCRPATITREHRPRILVSNNYEKQIEQIHERLISIEQSLKGLSLRTGPSITSPLDEVVHESDDPKATPVQFEGDSSFQRQTLRASELAGSLAGKQNIELTNAIKSLKSLVDTHGSVSVSDQKSYFSETRAKLPDMDLLPAAFVIALLKRIKERIPFMCLAYMSRDDVQLERLCQRAYFPTEQLSLGERTTMFGLLYCALQEYIVYGDQITKDYDCQTFNDICKKNFYAGIETYEIVATSTFYNATALMIGIIKALDEGRLSLAWTLSSTAARHVQVLGYHRESAYQGETPYEAQRKRYLFWQIYSMDKTLCLVLGRASYLQDYDIDVKLFEPTDDPLFRPWEQFCLLFVKLSKVQGQVYEQLYSSHAAYMTPVARDTAVLNLETSVQRLKEEFHSVTYDGAYASDMLDFFGGPTDIVIYSLETLIHRGISRNNEVPEVSSKCFDAARSSLETHLHHFPRFEKGGPSMIGTYVNWVLLYCTFTPIIVVFLHAIVSRSNDDIVLLEAVTASLASIRTISKECGRLYQTCTMFCRVAKAILESRQRLVGTYDQQADTFVFSDAASQQQTVTANIPDIFAQDGIGNPTSSDLDEMSMFFGNWLGGNQPVLDLLNMDFVNDT